MAINELQARQGNVNLQLTISEKGDVREFEKFGKKGRVCNAKGKDATGEITITLWNDDIDKVNVGDSVKIENGWVSEWQGELQLGTGKFGKLEVVSGSTEQPAPSTDALQPSAEPASQPSPEQPVEEDLDSLNENVEEEKIE